MARPGLALHPKFRRLVAMLDEGEAMARGCLECLWDVGNASGDPEIGDETSVALACHYPGKPARIVEALLRAGEPARRGFIEPIPERAGEYRIHDLHENAPSYVRDRWRKEQLRRARGIPPRSAAAFRHDVESAGTPGSNPSPAPAADPEKTTSPASGTSTDSGPGASTPGTSAPNPGTSAPDHAGAATHSTAQHSTNDKDTNAARPALRRARSRRIAEPLAFVEFWKAYPKKVGRLDALKAWDTMRDRIPPLGELLAAIELQTASRQWREDHGRFIPKPATWIRQGRWLDQPDPDEPTTPRTGRRGMLLPTFVDPFKSKGGPDGGDA